MSISWWYYLRLKQYLISISLNPFSIVNSSGKIILSTGVASSNWASLRPGSPGTSLKSSCNIVTKFYFSNMKSSNYSRPVAVAERLASLTAKREASHWRPAPYLCWNMHVGKVACVPSHYAGNLRECISHLPLPSVNKSLKPRGHQKSETEVWVAPQKWTWAQQFFFKKMIKLFHSWKFNGKR